MCSILSSSEPVREYAVITIPFAGTATNVLKHMSLISFSTISKGPPAEVPGHFNDTGRVIVTGRVGITATAVRVACILNTAESMAGLCRRGPTAEDGKVDFASVGGSDTSIAAITNQNSIRRRMARDAA